MKTRSALVWSVALCSFAGLAPVVHADTQREPSSATAAKLNAQLGVEYLRRGDVSIAQTKIEKALGQNADDPDVQTAAGLLYERIGEMDKASKHYQLAMQADPKRPDLKNFYAVFQCRRGDVDKGLKLLEEVAKDPRYATPEVAMANAGVCALSANKTDQAEKDFKQALNLNPTYPDALLQLAGLNFSRGDLINARGYLTRFMANVTPTADALLLGARIEHAAGDSRAAQEYATKLRHDFPQTDQVRQLDEVVPQ